ncbi:hypothetical protein DZF91_05085 [Actinomadura logoneensis]|uniref:DUF2273 domain-containing protein n=1 Tax=Actinomadura logoneensis TaxID=2293572 RepID=A0A372JSD8_9ACTN|nr:hypothetical protein [Actinomadura logoneensis]RFU42716.1 hypothetical protein DZF91_05085 [Actinomadura logoneensis]
MWSMVGLGFGTALGFAGVFGGLGGFLLVLVLGVVGLLVGRAVAGEIDLAGVWDSLGNSRKRPTA